MHAQPTETEPEPCLSVSCEVWVSSGLPQGQGSGCSRPGYGISPLGGGCHQPHHRAARTYTGLGKQTLGGHKQNPVHTRTQEKGAVTPQETDPDLPVSVQEWPAAESGALSEAGARHFLTSTIVWSQVKKHGGNTVPLINGKVN